MSFYFAFEWHFFRVFPKRNKPYVNSVFSAHPPPVSPPEFSGWHQQGQKSRSWTKWSGCNEFQEQQKRGTGGSCPTLNASRCQSISRPQNIHKTGVIDTSQRKTSQAVKITARDRSINMFPINFHAHWTTAWVVFLNLETIFLSM